MFLYGITSIESALRKLGGRRFVQALRDHTNNTVESILSGTVFTALLQSSSLVSLMVLALVGSQYIPMYNALGIIMGANLGTTFTGWIIAIFGFKLDVEQLSLPIIAIGALGIAFIQNNPRMKSVFLILFGFGLLIFGLGFMKSGMETILTLVDLTKYEHYGIVHFFVIGIIVTAIVQSSSAVMAITLSALSLQSISITQAAATVIGADLGTTITVVLGSLSGVSAKKQVAFFHVFYNLIVDLISLLFLPLLLLLIVEVIGVTDPLFTLVLFHNLFNAFGIILFIPFLPKISLYIQNKFVSKEESVTKFIQHADEKVPSLAIDAVDKEIERMFVQAVKYNMQILQVSAQEQNSILKDYSDYVQVIMTKNERYELLKKQETEILKFILSLKQAELSVEERNDLLLWTASMRNLVHSARSIKSIRHDLASIIRIEDSNSFKNRERLIGNSKKLYRKIVKLSSMEVKDVTPEELMALEYENESTHDQLVAYIYKHYSSEISTPLNVVREIYSSNKALINAMKEYKLDIDKLMAFEELPLLVR